MGNTKQMMMQRLLPIIFLIATVISCKTSRVIEQTSTKDFTKFEHGLNIQKEADSTVVGQSIQKRLDFHKVPGASVAIFEEGELVWCKAYGVLKNGTLDKVDLNTKFQAASISKAVTALGIFILVEKYKLGIDTDVNQYLKNWKVNYDEFSGTEKVTIRRLLDHSAGINVPGFYGYSKSITMPSSLQILNGEANNEKVKLDTLPGTKFLYSGGGYTILGQLIEDVSGMSYSEFMKKEIFEPLKMTHSSYDLFPERNISYAHDKEGVVHPEGWLVYPESAGAGLWTTPSDLAKFCVAIEDAYHNFKNPLILNSDAIEMLKPSVQWTEKNWWGLGVTVRGEDDNAFYFHPGSNPGGYRCMMVDFYKKRSGIIIMTNSDNGAALYNEILDSYFNFKDIKA